MFLHILLTFNRVRSKLNLQWVFVHDSDLWQEKTWKKQSQENISHITRLPCPYLKRKCDKFLKCIFYNNTQWIAICIFTFHSGPREKEELMKILDADSFAYTCGVTFEELTLPSSLDGHSICIKRHRCRDHVEVLYYANVQNDIICIYCSRLLPDIEWDSSTAAMYPKCEECTDRADMKIKRRSKKRADAN